MLLILKFKMNSFNTCLLKSNETCFCLIPELLKTFKFLYQCIVINIITMAHLVLFCFTLNLTDAYPNYLSVRPRVVQEPVNWFVVQIIWLVPVWCRVLPGGISEQILVVWLFINIFLYHWFSVNVAGLLKSFNVSFLSTHDVDVFSGAQE